MHYCNVVFILWQDLHSSLGFDAARKLSETVIEKDICELIDIDTPKVHACTYTLRLLLFVIICGY